MWNTASKFPNQNLSAVDRLFLLIFMQEPVIFGHDQCTVENIAIDLAAWKIAWLFQRCLGIATFREAETFSNDQGKL